MADPRFFRRAGPLSLEDVARIANVALDPRSAKQAGSRQFQDVSALDRATDKDISFLDNVKYVETFAASGAGACFVRQKFAHRAPESMALLITDDPYRCFAMIAQYLYPPSKDTPHISEDAVIASSATIGEGCRISAGVIIGERCEIGARCHIGANAVIHSGVVIGDDTHIGANSTMSHCLIGKHVIIHRGVHIGQDGFGFALGRDGHLKVPQLGRVVVEDHVEIGSGTCIDRGTGPDTFIGAGTKIDNLVQIGHNVQIGKLCVIVAQTGISGSTRIGDGVMLGGQSGIAGHLRLGNGSRVVAKSGIMNDVPAGETYGGSPAVPVKDWHRQTIALAKLASKKGEKDE